MCHVWEECREVKTARTTDEHSYEISKPSGKCHYHLGPLNRVFNKQHWPICLPLPYLFTFFVEVNKSVDNSPATQPTLMAFFSCFVYQIRFFFFIYKFFTGWARSPTRNQLKKLAETVERWLNGSLTMNIRFKYDSIMRLCGSASARYFGHPKP